MKIGFNLLLWTTHVVDANFPVLDRLKATGYDGVELPVFDTDDPAHFEMIGGMLKDLGLDCTAVTVCPDEARNPISPDAANRQGAIDHLKRVLDCAAGAGAEVLCGPYYQVLGQFTGLYPTEIELGNAAEVHRAVADHAESLNIKLGIESLNRFESHLLNTMAQARAYVQRVDKPAFGTMYDTFHANIEEKNPLEALKDNLDVVNHVHISENDRGTPGRGHCPLVETIQFLKQSGYDNWITIEAFGGALPELAAATRVWRDFFLSDEEVYTEGYHLIRETWDNA
jgi:D-psicose/D-tagatose/L-ribulose 3-epimerase